MPAKYSVYGPSVMPPTLAASTLELLAHPFTFSQSDLLSPRTFIHEARKRGVDLDTVELDLYHRRGLSSRSTRFTGARSRSPELL